MWRGRGRGPVIALVGVDGVGKSSQARTLAAALRAAGRPARSFENGGGRPLLDPLARRFGRRDGPDLLGRRAHLAVEATLRATAISIALAVCRLRGEIAVMDRYTYCQYATMRLRATLPASEVGRALGPSTVGTADGGTTPSRNALGPDGDGERVHAASSKGTGDAGHSTGDVENAPARATMAAGERWVRAFYRHFPTPDLVVWLTLPAEVAQRRVQLRGRDHEDLDRLVAFAAAYADLPEAGSFHQLAATGTVEEVHAELLRLAHATLAHAPLDRA
ncbi:Thymidylate kinase [Frankia sp. AiPs1]|uniref:thymidylate kinase n=1 Tax=Frankia sp. AiPa1 TaxID=573492 RepID=UPI00202B4A66|nr:thymidylate kinase [Frankia sp. AiPa1]MCL9759376.1 thymidylate kinase [Frankia sp. AiPa1]